MCVEYLMNPAQTVNGISKEAIATTAAMPRLAEALLGGEGSDSAPSKPSFYVQISNDEDILKVSSLGSHGEHSAPGAGGPGRARTTPSLYGNRRCWSL